jgi:hypothetical protein
LRRRLHNDWRQRAAAGIGRLVGEAQERCGAGRNEKRTEEQCARHVTVAQTIPRHGIPSMIESESFERGKFSPLL